ncbi:putative ABC transporter ATP-binding protein [Agrobacterium rubi TR3 = NBRC 13261]|uniref:Putative ABC transporter ATP-binding protein n=1 Tax=Agrobacterium rubi TR3 = NBRC 13261 TaxID=1368415 RepID=A0A081D1T3_9HYPH|nr:ABC transporter ATP-binding protein [Agrobacterium rubi]GAK72879.1 putative ABC transporter ATP-binding protein [Agrobacterium rubi TR3 = NBRC 13261]
MISLNHVTKSFHGHDAVRDVSFSVPEGSFLVLLGPSGCGKSTMLRMLAGLDQPTYGQIRYGETLVADGQASFSLPPANRDAGLVFQSYALWPRMTVTGNIDWPLKVAGLSAQERRERIADAMQMLGISQLAERYPGEISGGQQQRVALARMIAPRPKVMLFDEPLSNLDATLRVEMRFELLKLHAATGATAVYVTHDQVEAMTMATHVAVMNNGRVEQFGPPETLLDEPTSAFVAGFVGTPAANLIPVNDGQWLGKLPDPHLRGLTGSAMVRAEQIAIADEIGPDTIDVTLAEVVPMAGRYLVTGIIDGIRITAISNRRVRPSETLRFRLPSIPTTIFDSQGNRIS